MLTRQTHDALVKAIKDLHGCDATYVESVPVHQEVQGHPVWDGVVHVFDLEGHPKSSRAYAWAEPAAGSSRRQRFFALVRQGTVDSPGSAVRASIVEESTPRHGRRDDRSEE